MGRPETLPIEHPVRMKWALFQQTHLFSEVKAQAIQWRDQEFIEIAMWEAFKAGFTAAAPVGKGPEPDDLARHLRDAVAGGVGHVRVDADGDWEAPRTRVDEAGVSHRVEPDVTFKSGLDLAEAEVQRQRARMLSEEDHERIGPDLAHSTSRRPYRPGGPNDPAKQGPRSPIRMPDVSYDRAMRELDRSEERRERKLLGGALALFRLPEQDREDGRLQAFMGADRIVYWVPRS